MTSSFVHGTYRAYALGWCRCYRCCGYQNSRVARNRAARLAAGRVNHGTRSGYDCGCRCERCRAVRADEYRRSRPGVPA